MFELTEKDRMKLSGFIERRFGIQMPPSKKILLQTRLQKRALQLGYDSLRQYLDYFFSPQGQQMELDLFATIVSTHKTEFFREPDHFTILKMKVIPELLSQPALGDTETLVAWSSASSTGEEVYTIAMTLHAALKKTGRFSPLIKVIGTDISDSIVDFARKGIYSDKALEQIPLEYHQYLMRSKNPLRHEIRVVPELRILTDFRRQNLVDAQYKVKKGIHIIFCRNVLIYFDRSTQATILAKLVDLLAINGFLFIGHSESLSGMNLPLELIKPTVYQKIGTLHEKDSCTNC